MNWISNLVHRLTRKVTLPVGLTLALIVIATVAMVQAPSAYTTLELTNQADISNLHEVLTQAHTLRSNYTAILGYTDFANAVVKVLEIAGLGLGAIVLLLAGAGSKSVPPADTDRKGGSPSSFRGDVFSRISPSWVLFGLALVVVAHVVSEAYGSERRREILGRASFVIGCAISETTRHDGVPCCPATTRRARSLWRALNAVEGSVIAELSGAQLGGSRAASQQRRKPADDAMDACLTRLLTP